MRNIMVTGAASGLGLALTTLHLESGDRVWALSRRESADIERLKRECESLTFIACDISKTEYVKCALEPYAEAIGKLDCLYACAGVYSPADKVSLVETDLDKAAAMYDINAVGFLRVVQAVYDAIEDKTVIICISSEAGSISQNWRCMEYSYCMSKAAENMACVILQKHYDEIGQGTRVLCVHPGWMRTKMGGPEAFQRLDESVSPERSAECIANIALHIDDIPKGLMYMDYQRKPYSW